MPLRIVPETLVSLLHVKYLASGTRLELLVLNTSVEYNNFAPSAEKVNFVTRELRNSPGIC